MIPILTIQHQIYIRVSKEVVYQTIASAEGWNAWFTDETQLQIDSTGTGQIQFKWTNFGRNQETIADGGKIIEAVPGEKFVFQWSPGEKPTTVTITFSEYREGTLVSLEETGYSDSEKDRNACIGCAVGWGEALTLLKVYLEHGIVMKEDL